jgi:hypothetical protein
MAQEHTIQAISFFVVRPIGRQIADNIGTAKETMSR